MSVPESEFVRRAKELATQQEQLRQMFEDDRRSRRRRFWLGMVGFFLAVYTAVTLHDQHVEHCAVLGKPSNATERSICELTFWFHDHEAFDPEVIERLRAELGIVDGS